MSSIFNGNDLREEIDFVYQAYEYYELQLNNEEEEIYR